MTFRVMFLTPLAFSAEGENETIGDGERLLLLVVERVREGERAARDRRRRRGGGGAAVGVGKVSCGMLVAVSGWGGVRVMAFYLSWSRQRR